MPYQTPTPTCGNTRSRVLRGHRSGLKFPTGPFLADGHPLAHETKVRPGINEEPCHDLQCTWGSIPPGVHEASCI
ncbi:MAG: hypothetical protein JWP34_4686 [Massilia sp.]|nr:hypothetical protein [Massilia sp.]